MRTHPPEGVTAAEAQTLLVAAGAAVDAATASANAIAVITAGD
eukprot:gene5653-7295_t